MSGGQNWTCRSQAGSSAVRSRFSVPSPPSCPHGRQTVILVLCTSELGAAGRRGGVWPQFPAACTALLCQRHSRPSTWSAPEHWVLGVPRPPTVQIPGLLLTPQILTY